MNTISKSQPEKISAGELRRILSPYEPFAPLSDKAFEALASIADRVFLPGGSYIFRSGEAIEDAFVVEYGRVRLKAGEKFTLNGGRGETIGLLSVLTQTPFFGDLYALRDTKLIRFRGSQMLKVLSAHPELIVALARYSDNAIRRSIGIRVKQSRPQAYALMPVGRNPLLRHAADELFASLVDTAGPGCLIDSRRMQTIVGREVSETRAFENARDQLITWCESKAAEGHFLMFVCDPAETSWTRWCLKQTDRIVVCVDAEATDKVDAIDRKFAGHMVAGSPVRVDLLLVQKKETEHPRGTGAWMKLVCRRRHHHVRPGNRADFRRTARRMSEHALGVVLGGGGARGFAHLGVLQALEEAGMAVDVIGGTSMGAVMGACYARGWSPRRILDIARGYFTSSHALMDLDFPLVSLLRGRKLDNLLKSLYDDMDIADLWIPYYCISSNLSKGQMMLHDRGSLWQSVRASSSLPGIFPPVHSDGQLLVDGGLVDNIPTEIMASHCEGGKVIAVEVGGGAGEPAIGSRKAASGWRLLREQFRPRASRDPFANIFQIIVQSTTFSSKKSMQQIFAKNRVDLLLSPPVDGFQVLGFEHHEKIFDIGLEYTRKRLAEWDAAQD